MRTRSLLPLLAVLALGAAAAPAHAGIYTVYACDAAGQSWDNRSWALEAPVGGISADQTCPGDDRNMGLNANPGGRTAAGEQARYEFLSPPGTTIADFRLRKRIIYRQGTPRDTHRYHVISALGNVAFEGAGHYPAAPRDRLNSQGRWYGYPESGADTGVVDVSRASFPALNDYRGNSRSLTLRIGCTPQGGTPCGSFNNAHIANNILGGEVDVNDPAPPADLDVESSGLFDGGQAAGSDPVKLEVTDPSGIRRLEIVDVTGAPRVVGAEDYAAGVQTDRGGSCSFRLASPCPQLNYGETLRATSLETGRRRLVVRAIDAGGNVAQRGPLEVDVVTPSDRGPLNGAGATETGTITAEFTTGNSRTKRTIGFKSKAPVAGRLVNAAGDPISGARVAVLSRDLDDNDARLRTYLTTDGDGRFSYRASAYASRLYQFAWASHVNDVRFVANDYLTLRARAAAKLKARPKRVRVGRRVTLKGRLKGKKPRRSVDIVAQGRTGRKGRWRTFADGNVGRDRRFKVRYRFRDPSSRGRNFYFRIKIERDSGYAYYGGYSKTAKVRVR